MECVRPCWPTSLRHLSALMFFIIAITSAACYSVRSVNDVPVSCPGKQFKCTAGDQCVPIVQRCDGTTNCGDGSDERNCKSSVPCSQGEYRCKTGGSCIPSTWRCDGDSDCTDGSDEHEDTCQSRTNTTNCTEDKFACTTFAGTVTCFPVTWKCDGDRDCLDGSDEKDCSSLRPCRDIEFTCKNTGHCIRKAWLCDGDHDCPDGSDEQNCSTAVPESTV